MILIADGAPEFKSLKNISLDDVNIHAKESTGINKVVIAEVGIRKARTILREIEVTGNIKNMIENSHFRINSTDLKKILTKIENKIKEKAKLRKRKIQPKQTPLAVGTSVFALNFYKFYPHQLKSNFQKQSYMTNSYYERFEIVSYYRINGVYKYTLASFERTRPKLKYTFYQDQLQPINPDFAAEYIQKYHFNKFR